MNDGTAINPSRSSPTPYREVGKIDITRDAYNESRKSDPLQSAKRYGNKVIDTLVSETPA
jgi:hypothetical protein